MEFIIKEFSSLTTKELFEIYKMRSEVFVVEQNCAYQDVDEKDLSALHVMMVKGDRLIGYSRILPPGISYTEPSIGRVVLKKEFRKNGSGNILMKQTVNKTRELFKNQDIVISAQFYLLKFYTVLGFASEGDPYMEDDIPHVKMRTR